MVGRVVNVVDGEKEATSPAARMHRRDEANCCMVVEREGISVACNAATAVAEGDFGRMDKGIVSGKLHKVILAVLQKEFQKGFKEVPTLSLY
jgi:hypothetical protein